MKEICDEETVVLPMESAAAALSDGVGERKRKRSRVTKTAACRHIRSDFFDGLPDDIVLTILAKLCATARSPSDFAAVLVTCKRLNRLGLHPLVLSKAGPKTLALRAKNWCDMAHRFFRRCIFAGNVEALYILGMIRFYCLQNQGSGASLMAKAAIKAHAPALYSLALVQFNGSGGAKDDKDLRAGVALCARAAFLGHIDALRELGHCLQDGYGVRKNITEGRHLLVRANAKELASVLRAHKPSPIKPLLWKLDDHDDQSEEKDVLDMVSDPGSDNTIGSALWSDFGCNVPARDAHPVNKFLVEWFKMKGGGPGQGLRLCSHVGCGRPEIRKNEFRRCSGCGKVNYCSRGCQAHDWKMRHKAECAPVEPWMDQAGIDAMVDDGGADNGDVAGGEAVDGDGDDQTAEIEGDEEGGGAMG
ncbi:hypothetical protein RJ639_002499 [Escallonia herrerae]|uniref:MYND-type domain-containing protein n=1 Tax=Escallonia herrerae TaxID=1293975 RepID=A0AA88XBQ8_9ASTE|nr:hypothetical protein RJ639_002499 [Escallonia herrerae]